MKSHNRSLILSLILTKLLFIGLIVAIAVTPWVARHYDRARVIAAGYKSMLVPLLVMMFCAFAIAVPTVFLLHKLLVNIKNNNVFVRANVRILRVISYFCFAEGVVFFGFGFYRSLSFAISVAAIFFGVIMRVLKNVFDAAVEIKEENDLTV